MRHVALIALFATTALPSVPCQDAASPAPIAAVQRFVEGNTADATPASLAACAREVTTALAGRPEAAALGELAKILEPAGSWERVGREATTTLIDLLRKHRGKVPAEHLLPIALALERIAADRPEVQLSLAESYSTLSVVRDTARAGEALGKLLEWLGNDDLADFGSQLGAFCGFVGDASDLGRLMLRGYLRQLMPELDRGLCLRPLTADDLIAFRVIEELAAARKRGDQVAGVQRLEELKKLQPRNPVPPLLLAETHASLGPKFSADVAKKYLDEARQLMDPKRFSASTREPWVNLVDVRAVLTLLGWESMVDRSAGSGLHDVLLRHCEKLRGAIKPEVDERLVIAPHRENLQFQVKRLTERLPKLREDFDSAKATVDRLQRKHDAAKAAYERAGRSRGQFDQKRSDLHTKWGDAQRELDDAKPPLERAERRWSRAASRLETYERRLHQLVP